MENVQKGNSGRERIFHGTRNYCNIQFSVCVLIFIEFSSVFVYFFNYLFFHRIHFLWTLSSSKNPIWINTCSLLPFQFDFVYLKINARYKISIFIFLAGCISRTLIDSNQRMIAEIIWKVLFFDYLFIANGKKANNLKNFHTSA